MNFIADIDRISRADISSVQRDLLRETVSRLFNYSPHYRKKLNSLPEINSIENIKSLPVTGKEDIQADNTGFFCSGKDALRDVVATTGTTGAPVFIGLTAADIERLAENERRFFSLIGASSDDLFMLSVTMDNLFIAGLAYYSGLQRLGAGVIRIGPQSPKRHLEIIRSLKPTGIVAVPSFLSLIHKQAEKEGVSLKAAGVKKAMLIGETIRNPDFSPNTLGRMVEMTGIECCSTYGITEAQTAFCECPARRGFHSHPDMVYAEILDDAGNVLNDGEAGELVVTTFGIEAMPLLRYRTGDITFKISGVCECGRTSPRIGPIIGRKAQRLKLKGTTVYPRTIENAIIEIEGVENYVIEAYTDENHADQVVVKIGSHNHSSAFKSAVCEAIRTKARVSPQIEITNPEEIDRVRHEGGSRKPRIFIDRRPKNGF